MGERMAREREWVFFFFREEKKRRRMVFFCRKGGWTRGRESDPEKIKTADGSGGTQRGHNARRGQTAAKRGWIFLKRMNESAPPGGGIVKRWMKKKNTRHTSTHTHSPRIKK
jgi:hypothetical protein